MTPTNDVPAKKSAAKFLSARVVAVRAELSEVSKNSAAWARAAEKVLKADLLQLETRLAEVL